MEVEVSVEGEGEVPGELEVPGEVGVEVEVEGEVPVEVEVSVCMWSVLDIDGEGESSWWMIRGFGGSWC